MNIKLFNESIHGDVLNLFYSDQKKYAFSLQLDFLVKRFTQQQQIAWSDENTIQDRSIYEDMIFANMFKKIGWIMDIDYKIYKELFRMMSKSMRHPNVILYLDVDPKIALERIQKRGRDMEKDITPEYLESLKQEYDLFMDKISKTHYVIKIDWNDFQKVELIAHEIASKLKSVRHIEQLNLE